ncbi:toll/interleukin-1 receptor domain-containing protein [Microbacterium stercoris]|uniref:Toll/interleukin-1 receptor domain-containing protein n=1 Tax=Microbacterium stercoris TaxID=2820289 RepID=A0A939QKX5_9MICO|nr:toll/interleukin-1 receptor domain-containing protein [Microbacterium stercoris]MBO3664070.1 toll/interleukin-1 receptor domain-containing protein [Microbacterium stercoris]
MSKLSTLRDYFLSHAGDDKEFVKSVASRMQLAGRETFLDEWSIDYGESIPGAIAQALRHHEAIVLFWSQAALESAWVRREFNSAISRFIEEEERALLVVRLDQTEVPELVRDMKWIDGRDMDPDFVASAVMGMKGNERLIAMQNALDELGIQMQYFPGYGILLACPRCGATVDKLTGWHESDFRRDDEYAGARCTICGWHDGGEV